MITSASLENRRISSGNTAVLPEIVPIMQTEGGWMGVGAIQFPGIGGQEGDSGSESRRTGLSECSFKRFSTDSGRRGDMLADRFF
jgi:hypothetical protein